MLVPRRTEHTVVKAPKSSHITPVLRSLHCTGKFTILVHSPNNREWVPNCHTPIRCTRHLIWMNLLCWSGTCHRHVYWGH